MTSKCHIRCSSAPFHTASLPGAGSAPARAVLQQARLCSHHRLRAGGGAEEARGRAEGSQREAEAGAQKAPKVQF